MKRHPEAESGEMAGVKDLLAGGNIYLDPRIIRGGYFHDL